MNLIVVTKKDFVQSEGGFCLGPRQAQHIILTLKKEKGDSVRVGVQDSGWIGNCEILNLNQEYVVLQTNENWMEPEEPSQEDSDVGHIDVIMALPRPRVFNKLLQYFSSLGLRKAFFFVARRTELSYLGSSCLKPEKVQKNVLVGMEQSMSMVPTEVYLFASWEKCREALQKQGMFDCQKTVKLVPHPGTEKTIATCVDKKEDSKILNYCLLLGPEGGFLEDEIEKFVESGFIPVNLGSKILRVEVALISTVAQCQARQEIFKKFDNRSNTETSSGMTDTFLEAQTQCCWCDAKASFNGQIRVPVRGRMPAVSGSVIEEKEKE